MILIDVLPNRKAGPVDVQSDSPFGEELTLDQVDRVDTGGDGGRVPGPEDVGSRDLQKYGVNISEVTDQLASCQYLTLTLVRMIVL